LSSTGRRRYSICTGASCPGFFVWLFALSPSIAIHPALAEPAGPTLLPEIAIIGSGGNPQPSSAGEVIVPRDEVLAQPAVRPGEVLEQTPGLIVTQHSGEGKANQYYLRGFNLDHGTDLAITIDGMPVNMRTHGHGQGYADVNFLIPELVQSMRVRKGPYFADEGDFASAGSIHIDYVDALPRNLALATGGSFGYWRGLASTSTALGGGSLLATAEATAYDGPWAVGDNVRKLNRVVRYSQGTAVDGFSVTGMAYSNRWNSTDQIAARAVEQGLTGRFGTLDPTDGGKSDRYSLSGRWSQAGEWGVTRMNGYAILSSLTLFNNFTYFHDDEVNGDQFSQLDRRAVFGLNGSHTFFGRLGTLPSQTTFGVQTRYDDIHVALGKTVQRAPLSTVRDDRVGEGSAGVYLENKLAWTPWLRTVAGLRYDYYSGGVDSDAPVNSGSVSDGIVSPKLSVIAGPWLASELFLNAGTGFHSNDLRGATILIDPNTGLAADRVPLLVRSQGAEVGVRTRAIRGLDSAVALFVLDYDSELLFVGDAGTTEASRPSRRVGIEWTNHYQPLPWLGFDLDIAHTRARFTDVDPAGNRIPGSPQTIASAAVVVGHATGWFGAMKLRYFGPRSLIEDDSVRSSATAVVNARVGYRFEGGLRVFLDAFNLFNASASQIDYFYESRLAGEPPGLATADRHFHPVEPLAVRLTVAAGL